MLPWTLFAIAWPAIASQQVVLSHPRSSDAKTVSLRHAIAYSTSPDHRGKGIHRPIDDFSAQSGLHEYSMAHLALRTKRQKVWRPRARGGSTVYTEARRASVRASRGQPHPLNYEPMGWDELDIEAPDVSDMDTLASLAKMTSNAYIKDHESGWYEVGGDFNTSISFGWKDDAIRGHIFATSDNSTIVVAIKGTSSLFVGGNGKTNHNDKVNDNLLFSCCCARVDWSWSTVCDCYGGGWKCDGTCVEDALIEKSVYYPIATDLYNNVTRLFPHSQIWLTGHSLGGSLASLLSLTFGVPCVTFEAPGDLLPARRLHLPMPPGRPANSSFGAITHVYHTGDPIPQGACTGSLSPCSLAGFAMETRCHTGQTVRDLFPRPPQSLVADASSQILFDTVGKLGWSVDTRTHSIAQVIDRILIPDWDKPPSARKAFTFPWRRKKTNDTELPPEDDDGGPWGLVPQPVTEAADDCVDCFRWEFTGV